MSHLPLDARAILHYLNELGFRNISAEQLKEFLKGMQPQSEIIKKSKFRAQQQRILQQQQLPTTPTTRNPTAAASPTIPGGSPASLEAGAKAASTTLPDSYKRGGGPSIKVIKCKKPLCHFKFYLDICDHQLTKRIEDQIKLLGGSLEFFLTPNVTHFVTDKPINAAVNQNNNANSCPGTPQTPQTPQTPFSLENLDCSRATNNGIASVSSKKPIRNSRADAILNRARRLSTAAPSTTPKTTGNCNTRARQSIGFDQAATTPLKSIDNVTAPSPPYIVWPCENALKFFKKVQHELKDYLVESPKGSQKTYTVEPISLKGGFIKIEALKRNYRPYYQLFKKPTSEWPKIELTREDGAFRLSPKKANPTTSPKEDIQKIEHTTVADAAASATVVPAANQLKEGNMTRKSRSRSTQNLKKPQENDLIKSPANSQKNSVCKNQAQQKDSTDKQCGVCEICKIEYDALTIHLKTKDHEYFAKNTQNFIALDTLIHTSADVSKFLDGNHKLELKTELEEMEVDQMELVNNDEVDPLNDDANDEANDQELHGSCSFSKGRQGGQLKLCSPTLREKSKRSTKGKHSSEKFKNANAPTAHIGNSTTTNIKSPKTASPPKSSAPLLPLDVKAPGARKKHSGNASNAALSPPIRAMLPPNSLYKVETHTEVQCTPTKNRIGAGEGNAVVASPSIIVKFKKVRHAELQLLNGEAENFMFPKKTNDSSDMPTDIDRHTTSDRAHNTASIGTTSPSHSSPSASPLASDEENDEEYEMCPKKNVVVNGKKAISKAKRRLPPCKIVVTTTPVKMDGGRYTYPKTPPPKFSTATTNFPKWGDSGGRQSFPKTPIQPFEQLKKPNEKRNSAVAASNPSDILAETAKIMFPEATRKSSRTATAIVTAATTSTRLLQAAVDAAKNKSRTQLSSVTAQAIKPVAKSKTCHKTLNIIQKQDIKMETVDKPKQKEVKDIVSPASRKLRLCVSQSVVRHLEDRMGEILNSKSRTRNSKTQIVTKAEDDTEDGVGDDEDNNDDDVGNKDDDDEDNDEDDDEDDGEDDDDDDDDITVDNDDEKDEDYVHKTKRKPTQKKLASTPPKAVFHTPQDKLKITSPPILHSSSKREERLVRRQSRVIAQIKLELHSDFERQEEEEQEQEQEFIKALKTEKTHNKPAKCRSKSPSKKVNKKITTKHSPVIQDQLPKEAPAQEVPSTDKTEKLQPSPSRCFDFTKSEHLKKLRYSFERLPSADLWYQVYQRQDNCKEKYFEYFGSTKYRKLPYEMGPVPFEMSLQDSMATKLCCKLCQIKEVAKQETEIKQKAASKDLFIDQKQEKRHDKKFNQQHEDNNCSSTSAAAASQLEHSKLKLNTSALDSTQLYAHKHKKLHLLQRYRQEQQEQQELLQREKLEEQVQRSNNLRLCGGHDDIKMDEFTQDSMRSREERAGSIHSNISSCASSAGTYSKAKAMHKKLLNKTAYMAHLELPPRKSPREHASTLALVSCIIKQRQDSVSKPNSETDESPKTPTEEKTLESTAASTKDTNVVKEEEIAKVLARLKTPPPQPRKSPFPEPNSVLANSPRTRSHAATPVEELRFATEISENVKRMRRGRNKYDYSPPFVARAGSARSSKNRTVINTVTLSLWGGERHFTGSTNSPSLARQKSQPPNVARNNKIRTGDIINSNSGTRPRGRPKGSYKVGAIKTDKNSLAMVRKTGTKKGVLEFDMNPTALQTLHNASLEYKNPKLLEWQIDKFLGHIGSDLDLQKEDFVRNEDITSCASPPQESPSQEDDERYAVISPNLPPSAAANLVMINTPPATDCFSSDFDLFDIIKSDLPAVNEKSESITARNHKTKFSIFNSAHMQGYYRKRKNLKSNRTGWPKAPRRKAATRQQSMSNKIYFLPSVNADKDAVTGNGGKRVVKQEIEQEELDDTTQDQTRESGVITPPDTETENQEDNGCASPKQSELMEGDEEDCSQRGCNEYSQSANGVDDDEDEEDDVDNDTLADSIEEEIANRPQPPVDSDADIEEEDEEDEDKEREDDFDAELEDTQDSVECKKLVKKSKRSTAKLFLTNEDDEDSYEPMEKRLRCLAEARALSPLDKSRSNLLSVNTATTSTPTTPFMRALRRTPQMNGSLGSCISPSEKAGDNSDIFTVSSDGLDTDLDLSNSHSLLRNTCGEDDHHNHHHHHHQHHLHPHNDITASAANNSSATTPKRKFDISKYAPTNAASCAAEAATAAVKSLAISQFLKKEVRVQCRRLRAPFRRFRYRR